MRMRWKIVLLAAGVLTAGVLAPGIVAAEVCTTQSQMTATDRESIARAARSLAALVQANDVSGLRAVTVAEYAKDFNGIGDVVGGVAPKLKGAGLVVEQVYLLDGTQLKRAADGTLPDAQFFCSLNQSAAEADFLIPGLDAGRYGFALVRVDSSPSPWRLSFLMRQEQGRWAMAGFYPKPLGAAGHDGLWYWTEARAMAARKEHWSAWLFYQQAEALLRPANFVQSTHLEKLRAEQTAAAPPAVADGVSADAPLVIKGANGAAYRLTRVGVDDSLGKEKIDITVRLKVDQMGDAAVARTRSTDAARALLAAYPELRKSFHGVWVITEAPGQSPFATEQAINEIH